MLLGVGAAAPGGGRGAGCTAVLTVTPGTLTPTFDCCSPRAVEPASTSICACELMHDQEGSLTSYRNSCTIFASACCPRDDFLDVAWILGGSRHQRRTDCVQLQRDRKCLGIVSSLPETVIVMHGQTSTGVQGSSFSSCMPMLSPACSIHQLISQVIVIMVDSARSGTMHGRTAWMQADKISKHICILQHL